MTTPAEHLSRAAALLDDAEDSIDRRFDTQAGAQALMSQAHTLLAGELLALQQADGPTEVHRCELPTDVPDAWKVDELRCVDCGLEWRPHHITAGHIVWVAQRVLERKPMPVVE